MWTYDRTLRAQSRLAISVWRVAARGSKVVEPFFWLTFSFASGRDSLDRHHHLSWAGGFACSCATRGARGAGG